MKIARCTWHKPDNLSYTHFHYDAEERGARGERQRQCTMCGLWHWPHEWGDEPEGLNPPMILAEADES